MVFTCEKSKTKQERYLIPRYKSSFIKFPAEKSVENYLFHSCDYVKLDFYKFKAEYKGDSQEMCLKTIVIKINGKIMYKNNASEPCFTTNLDSNEKEFSPISVNLKNTEFKKFCNYF